MKVTGSVFSLIRAKSPRASAELGSGDGVQKQPGVEPARAENMLVDPSKVCKAHPEDGTGDRDSCSTAQTRSGSPGLLCLSSWPWAEGGSGGPGRGSQCPQGPGRLTPWQRHYWE